MIKKVLCVILLVLPLPMHCSWTDTTEVAVKVNINDQQPAILRVDATFGVDLSKHVVYNLLCLALGITGSGITYSGIHELIQHDNHDHDNHTSNRIGWWKTTVGFAVTIGSIIALFHYERLNKMFNARIVIQGT